MGLFDGFMSGAAGPLAGGILGSIGSVMNNNMQLKIARETNKLNRQMFDDQLEFNEMMWNKQNEYNDPLAQRQRLENAGLNPLFFGLDGNGNASGWQSATPVPAQGASVQNPLSSLAAGLSSIPQARNLEADTKGKELDNYIKDATKEDLMRVPGLTVKGLHWDNFNKEKEWDVMYATQKQIGADTAVAYATVQEKLNDMDVSQREIFLKESDQKFEQWLDTQNLSIEQKRLALDSYKTIMYGKEVESKIELNGSMVTYYSTLSDVNKASIPGIIAQSNILRNDLKNYKLFKSVEIDFKRSQTSVNNANASYISEKESYLLWDHINESLGIAVQGIGAVSGFYRPSPITYSNGPRYTQIFNNPVSGQ